MSPSSTSRGDGSTTWPWMKNAKSRLEDPIPPVDEHDKRSTVQELIRKYHKTIVKLRDKLKEDPLYRPTKHDDLWILRFLLSHGWHHHKALEAAKATLSFRQEYRLDEKDIRFIHLNPASLLEVAKQKGHPISKFASSAEKMMSCYSADDTMVYYKTPDDRRSIIEFLRLAERNQRDMAQRLSEQDFCEAHLFLSERKFQWVDYHTRTTGRLTKYLNVTDCANIHLNMLDKDCKKLDANAAKRMENQYPQLLGNMAVIHAPTWIHMVFVMAKPILPTRLLSKVSLISPQKHKKDLHVLLEYCAEEHLPVRYGGKLETWPPPSNF